MKPEELISLAEKYEKWAVSFAGCITPTCQAREYRAIAEGLRLLAGMQWQPIETAPKDGSLIMIGGTSYAGWFWSDAKWLDGWMMWSSTDDDWNVECFEASHWMPLPAPPQGPDTRPVCGVRRLPYHPPRP